MNRPFNKEKLVAIINSSRSDYKLTKSKFEHYTVTPLPSETELQAFYKHKYLEDEALCQRKGMDTNEQSASPIEQFHFSRQYQEVSDFIDGNFQNKTINILDVGCGKGSLLRYLSKKGFKNLFGTEYDSRTVIDDINIFHDSFLKYNPQLSFDFINFTNVLEHVREPEFFLENAISHMTKDGILRVQVPNDLSYTQYKATINKKNPNFYFFSPPEHLQYFDFESIKFLIEHYGFEIIKSTTDWSMDLFILMGLDYSEDPLLGKTCHNYRTNLEFQLGKKLCGELYEKLAQLGIGRDVILYAKRKNNEN